MIRNLLDLAIEIRDGICALLATSWPEDDPPWRPDHLHIGDRPCAFEDCGEHGTHFHHDGRTWWTIADYQASR